MTNRFERLKELLLQDRSFLLAGDFSKLNVNSVAIDEIVSELEAGRHGGREAGKLIQDVQKLATRNASLLSASIEGTKAAREKIEMIRRATSQLNTYTVDGTVEDVSLQSGKIEKRA